MSRYIDYDAIDYRNDKMHDKSSDFIDGVIYMAQRIEDAPSIDIEPKRGEWVCVKVDTILSEIEYECSECKEVYGFKSGDTPLGARLYFCPNCGADMRKESE